jgi:hypothetical protein
MIASALRRSLVQSSAIAIACVAAVMAPVATSAPGTHPQALRMESAAFSSTTCTGLAFNGQWYCTASISGVKSTAYGVGQRVVLQSVSVTAKTKTIVTVAALESSPCPAGQYCGATLTTQTLTMSWSKGQPAVGSVVHVFGTSISANLTPVGSQPAPPGTCYIDYC